MNISKAEACDFSVHLVHELVHPPEQGLVDEHFEEVANNRPRL